MLLKSTGADLLSFSFHPLLRFIAVHRCWIQPLITDYRKRFPFTDDKQNNLCESHLMAKFWKLSDVMVTRVVSCQVLFSKRTTVVSKSENINITTAMTKWWNWELQQLRVETIRNNKAVELLMMNPAVCDRWKVDNWSCSLDQNMKP
jgi:hypothetical protein